MPAALKAVKNIIEPDRIAHFQNEKEDL